MKKPEYYCSDCGAPQGPGFPHCDYNWSGQCSVADYNFLRDHEPVMRTGQGQTFEGLMEQERQREEKEAAAKPWWKRLLEWL